MDRPTADLILSLAVIALVAFGLWLNRRDTN
jgi:hypothetical protein